MTEQKPSFGRELLIALGRPAGQAMRDEADEIISEVSGVLKILRKDPSIVTIALEDALHKGPMPIDDDDAKEIKKGMRRNISPRQVSKRVPQWMHPDGIPSAAGELTAPGLWYPVLQAIRPEDARQQVKADDEGDALLASIFAINNSRFMTSAVTLGLYSAAIGEGTESIVPRFRRRRLNTSFVGELGKRFGTPAEDGDEFLERVQSLVPNPDTDDPQGKDTLFKTFVEKKIFSAKDNYCPATHLSKTIMHQWGRQLATDPVYQERFRRLVSEDAGETKELEMREESNTTVERTIIDLHAPEPPVGNQSQSGIAAQETEPRFTVQINQPHKGKSK